MNIFACCNWGLKFTGLLVDGWRARGHAVEFRPGYDPALHEWADLTFVDACDHNAQVASRNRFKGKLMIRAIDIECWAGQPGGVEWANVDALVFGARHIQEMTTAYLSLPPTVRVSLVPFGIDINKWQFRERDGAGRRVACVAHRWSAKGLPLLYQVVAKLGPGWSLHLLGTRSTEKWLHAYLDHIEYQLGIEVTKTDSVPSVDEWLEDKDYHVCASYKEAFSYATAEAAAKGLMPLVHDFWRAGDVWPAEWIWRTVDEACEKMRRPLDSRAYRACVEERYSLERMLAGLDEAMEAIL